MLPFFKRALSNDGGGGVFFVIGVLSKGVSWLAIRVIKVTLIVKMSGRIKMLMRRCFVRSMVCFTVFCGVAGAVGSLQAQALLPPPFGLEWGDTPDKVLDWAAEQKLDVNIKIPGKRPEIRELRVSAEKGTLPSHQARVLEARYHWGKLFEVTLHYGSAADDAVRLRGDFDKVKSALTRDYGTFRANNKKDFEKDGYLQRSFSYHIEPVSGLMLLIAFTELEDTERGMKSARFSILYQNHNILPNE